jgi:eukaryotic-like serine/threonine-protein kinase
MPSERIERIRELFHAALELPSDERAAFLATACAGDGALEAKVTALLASNEEAEDFLEAPVWAQLQRPAGGPADAPENEPEAGLPFERLGEFRLIRPLGEGGMGVVYLAVQESLDRNVALKVIRPEQMGSFEMTKRFWREVEAVSSLRHPNIVTVFGSGEEEGVCYFAMELLPGKGLNDLLREAAGGEKIPTPKILEWIGDIARALESAHEAGIIHRDVKPSNIRITPDGRAMLTDFGVALHADFSTLTLTGQFRGTPHYASPEQVRARKPGIDARTDIYSLGVTLYQAVAGRVPFEGETTEQVFHQILEGDLLSPRRLNPSLSRDLETVILAAMEKDPGRRYQSMADFAGDLERLQSGEMILAKPAGFATRLWKRARRRPALTAALCVGMISTVVFLAYLFFWSLPQIVEEKNKALNALAEARKEKAAAVVARNAAEKEVRRTGAINEFLQKVFTSADPGMDGRNVKVVDVLDDAVKGIEGAFPDDPSIEATLHNMIGNTYLSLGFLDLAEERFEAAEEISRLAFGEEAAETLGFQNNIAKVLCIRGDLNEAEKTLRRILESYRRTLGEENRGAIMAIHNLARVLLEKEKIPEAEALFRREVELARSVLGEERPDTLNARDALVGVMRLKGDILGAEVLCREVMEIRRRVQGEEHGDTVASMNNLVLLLCDQKKYDEAEPLQRKALELARRDLSDEHHETLAVTYNLVVVLWEQGKISEAEPMHRNLVDSLRRVLGEENQQTINCMSDLATYLDRIGKSAEAESIFRQTLEVNTRKHGAGDGRSLSAMNGLATALLKQGKMSEAEPVLSRLVEISKGTMPEKAMNRLLFQTKYGDCLLKLKRWDEAEPQLLSSYQGMMEKLGGKNGRTQWVLAKVVELYDAWEKPEKAAEYRALLLPPGEPGAATR